MPTTVLPNLDITIYLITTFIKNTIGTNFYLTILTEFNRYNLIDLCYYITDEVIIFFLKKISQKFF